MPSASSLLLASSNAHVCILCANHQRSVTYLDHRTRNQVPWLPLQPSPPSRHPLARRHTFPKRPESTLHFLSKPSNGGPKAEQQKHSYSRRIRLVGISHDPQQQTAPEPVHPRILPPLVLVLLARWDAEQPAGRRIVVALVRSRVGRRVLRGLVRVGGGERASR